MLPETQRIVRRRREKHMYQTMYIDIIFLTNLLMDYVILRLVGKFLHFEESRIRCFVAALLGAAFSCLLICLPFNMGFPAVVLLHCGCALFMAALAFRIKKGSLLAKTILSMYLTAFTIGGIYQALEKEKSRTVKTFLLLMTGIYVGLYTVLCLWDAFRLGRKNIYPVTLTYQGKTQRSYGFFDTGNLLTDPVNMQPVSVVKKELLEKILSEELVKKLQYIKEEPENLKCVELTGLQPHFLSCRTAEGKEGLLLAVVLGELKIHTPGRVVHVGKPVLAVTFEPSALGEEYGILLNSRLLN